VVDAVRTGDGTSGDGGSALGVGDVLTLEVGDVAHGGVFVARHEGRVVFVGDAAPGERVEARVTDVRKRFVRAEALRVVDASPERREHVWREASIDRDPAERAGGAEFGHLALPFQRELKRRVVTDALQRFGDTTWTGEVEGLPGDDETRGTGWRTRITLHADESGVVGPYAARSHRVVPVETLPLGVPEFAAALDLSRRVAPGARVELVAAGLGGRPSEPARADEAEPTPGDGGSAAGPDVRMRVVPSARGDRDGSHALRGGGDRRRGGRGPGRRSARDDSGRDADARGPRAGVVTEFVGERAFRVDEDGFWQVHRFAASALSRAVAEACATDALDAAAANLDLYGGVGLLAAAFADAAGDDAYIETVEAAPGATAHARRNLAGIRGATAVTARVDRYVRDLEREASARDRDALRRGTIVLDPPRAGAGLEVVDAVAAFEPAQVVYVACDPVAFARDAGAFRAHGYEVETLRAFDLFPSTHHVECVARLRRA